MMENNWRIADLIKKHLQDELTDTERAELDVWLAASPSNLAFFQRFDNPAYVAGELRLMGQANPEAALAGTLAELGLRAPVRRMAWRRWAVAAALLAAVATGAWFLLQRRPSPADIAVRPPAAKDIPAGTDKAILTLADGSHIVLDSAANGRVAQQGGAQVMKEGGKLKYDGKRVIAEARGAESVGAAYNTVSTPRGGQYQLVLQDGTKVWLNAASVLRFPAVFNGKERRVELTGEGYFEVGVGRVPFIVSVAGREDVEVLGTHFNIMAYNEEPQVKTTLLEGKVKVAGRGAATVLAPGQQALLGGVGALKVEAHADVDQAVAWKNGMQSFQDADIQTIMRQVSRWYNIDVEYQGAIPALALTGKIPRTVSLNHVLEALELNSGLHLQLANGKVVVTP